MKPQKCFLSIFPLTIALLLLAHEAQAVFTMTVAPRRGGQNIRFEEFRPETPLRNEEATLTVTSTEAAQYTVLMTAYQPLTNQFGNVIPQENFVVSSPSAPLGTLTRLRSDAPVMMGQVPIFSSNSAGDTDSFILVFAVHAPENQPAGIYHTQLTFTADLVNHKSGVSASVVNMDVEIEIRPTFRITIISSKESHRLDLGRITKDRSQITDSLTVKIESNIGAPYSIIQQMTEPLTSQEGISMKDNALTFFAVGAQKGSLKSGNTPTPLPESPAPIYTSGSYGQSDQFQIQYILKPEATQREGTYVGNIIFKVDSNSPFASADILNIPIKAEVEAIFDLGVEIEGGGYSLHLGKFQAGSQKQEKKVTLTVHSNLGKPYQVSQIVSRKLTSGEGVSIPPENFVYYGMGVKSGSVLATAPTPVVEGETIIYASDSGGSPDQMILDYTLDLPLGTRAGSYTSDVRYSISTL